MTNTHTRERLNLISIKNDCEDNIKQIENGSTFICRFADGTIVCANNNGSNGRYKCIMYNPKNQNATKYELFMKDFRTMYKEVLNFSNNLYFMIEKNEQDMTECAPYIADALMAMHSKTKSYNGYKMRLIGD